MFVRQKKSGDGWCFALESHLHTSVFCSFAVTVWNDPVHVNEPVRTQRQTAALSAHKPEFIKAESMHVCSRGVDEIFLDNFSVFSD